MSTIIKVDCNYCGSVAVSPDSVKILSGEEPMYLVECHCERLIHQPADTKVMTVLLAVGCEEAIDYEEIQLYANEELQSDGT